MATFIVEVTRTGSIIVEGVDSLHDAKAYIENCSPIDEVNWKNFLEAGYGEEVFERSMEESYFDGKVLWYSDRLGYGIICGKDCETYFIHHKDIISSSIDEGRHRKHLLRGEKVAFDWCWKPDTDNKKRQAINLKVVE